MDESTQRIVDTLNNNDELSITIQVTEDATRTLYNIPSVLPLADLAVWAATMLDAQNILFQMWHQHCKDLGVPTEQFDEAVKRMVAKLQKIREESAQPDEEPPAEDNLRSGL